MRTQRWTWTATTLKAGRGFRVWGIGLWVYTGGFRDFDRSGDGAGGFLP